MLTRSRQSRGDIPGCRRVESLCTGLKIRITDHGGSYRRIIARFLIASSLATASACSIVNPYENDFSCPDTFHGKCISVSRAYGDALVQKAEDNADKGMDTCIGGDCKDYESIPRNDGNPEKPAGTIEDRNYNSYRTALYSRFDKLLREPKTPVVAPPKVMRILFLPYKGSDGEFHMPGYVYFFADDPKWILADSVEAFED